MPGEERLTALGKLGKAGPRVADVIAVAGKARRESNAKEKPDQVMREHRLSIENTRADATAHVHFAR